MSNKTDLQSNNNDLQSILNTINELPTLPNLSNPATVDKVLDGYEYIDGGGNQKVGTISSKAATTYRAKTNDQTIAAGQYLSGTQTIKKVEQSGLSAANIVAGKTITIKSNGSNLWNVTGTYTHGIYSGVGTPIYDKGTCFIPMTEAYREGNVGFEKDSISLYCDGTDWHKNSAVTTANAINLTNITQIVLIARLPQSGTSTALTARIVLTSSKPNSHSGNVTEKYTATATGNTISGGTKTVTVTLDTSNITGNYYILADAYSGAQSVAFTMHVDTMYYI